MKYSFAKYGNVTFKAINTIENKKEKRKNRKPLARLVILVVMPNFQAQSNHLEWHRPRIGNYGFGLVNCISHLLRPKTSLYLFSFTCGGNVTKVSVRSCTNEWRIPNSNQPQRCYQTYWSRIQSNKNPLTVVIRKFRDWIFLCVINEQ